MSSPVERFHKDYWRYIYNNPGCSSASAERYAKEKERKRHEMPYSTVRREIGRIWPY